ncbi:hypothetical protein [Streptomyces sp. ICC4]|uniref:hypothetical protein n=1 Tax=Streptomyces sp. ICC4 TaxID=2099584 RepID=UPI0013A68B8A
MSRTLSCLLLLTVLLAGGSPAALREAGPGAAEVRPAWAPPTLAGSPLRAVDPARARAEGRSPIIDPGPRAAILTAALGLVIAAAAALGKLALLAPLIALQGLTAAGWFRLNGRTATSQVFFKGTSSTEMDGVSTFWR